MPVADVLRRIQHARNGNAAHEAAWLLFEVILKLGTAAQLGIYQSQPARNPKVSDFLARAFDAPAVGTWNTLYQLVAAALRDVPEADRLPLSGTFAQLTRRQQLPATAAFLDFWERLRRADKAGADGSDRPSRGSAESLTIAASRFFNELCAYRNHEIGHKGLRSEAHYHSAARLLTAALVEVWGALNPLADFRLGVVRPRRDPLGAAPGRCCDLLLGDLSRSPLDGSSLRPDILERVAEGSLVLVNDRAFVPLPPLLIYETDNQELPEIALLNGIDRDRATRVVRGVNYLVHQNGRRVNRPGAALQEFLRSLDVLDSSAAAPEPVAGLPIGDYHGASASVLGGFPLLREHRRGPRGVVFRSRHSDRDVTVKIFTPGTESEAEYFLQILAESRTVACAGAAHLVEIVATGREQGAVFAVTEWVHGGSLGDLLRAANGQPRMSQSAMIELGTAVALGLGAVHERGVVHGNLKPDNVLLPADWEQAPVQFQNAKLADIGFPPLADSGADVATWRPYRAPEVRSAAARADERSDLFALGAVLFHAATGLPPTPTDSSGNEGLLRSRRDRLSDTFVDVVLQLLCPDPAGRFQRAVAVANALGAGEGSGGDSRPAGAPVAGTAVETAIRITEHNVRLLQQLQRQRSAGRGE